MYNTNGIKSMWFGSIRSVDSDVKETAQKGFDVRKFPSRNGGRKSVNSSVRAHKSAKVRRKPSQPDIRATDRRIDRRRARDSESCEIDNMLGDIPIILSSPPSKRTVGW